MAARQGVGVPAVVEAAVLAVRSSGQPAAVAPCGWAAAQPVGLLFAWSTESLLQPERSLSAWSFILLCRNEMTSSRVRSGNHTPIRVGHRNNRAASPNGIAYRWNRAAR